MIVFSFVTINLPMQLVQSRIKSGQHLIRALLRAENQTFAANRDLRHVAIVGVSGRLVVRQLDVRFLDGWKVVVELGSSLLHMGLNTIRQSDVAGLNVHSGCHTASLWVDETICGYRDRRAA